MDMEFCQNGVFLLIVLFFALYSLLDGFDLGIGMLLPFTRDKDESARLVSHIAPFWDGNEVWLVIAAGFVFGAFPSLLGLLLGTVYLPFLLLIVGLILRSMALEYSYHDLARQRMWHGVAACGSYLVTVLGLFVLGTVVQGLPFEKAGVLSTRVGDYIAAFPILFSAAGVIVVMWHGLTYALGQDPSDVAREKAKSFWPMLAVAGVVLLAAWFYLLPGTGSRPVVLLGAALCLGGGIASRFLLGRKGGSFRASCVTVAGLWLMIAATLYPAVLPARHHPEWSLTLASATAPLSTLRILVIVGLILVPVTIGYSYFIYRVFRRPAGERKL